MDQHQRTCCFDIEIASLAYGGGRPVLQIADLCIQKGKLYFIVGRSGVGKSTLLEALGMMNRTILPSTQRLNFHDSRYKRHDLIQLFDSKKALTALRSTEYSFIFQETNLMPNLTAGENMMLSSLVSGKDPDVIAMEIRRLLPKFKLPEEVFDCQVQHLSGGQRQRLAFIRAFIAEYSVLFGDEPTGNLDPVTARDIMSILKHEITTKGKTGIIVSHDVHLAVEKADAIIYISSHEDKEGKSYGRINGDHVFYHNDVQHWHKGSDQYDDSEVYMFLIDRLAGRKSMTA